MKASGEELNKLIEKVLSSTCPDSLAGELKTFSRETLALLLTFVQTERASCLYLPLMAASTPLELFAKNLSCLESDERFYTPVAVALLNEREILERVRGKGRALVRAFVEAQERNKEALKRAVEVVKKATT